MSLIEVNFDGLVGPTHNYAGLSRGNLAASLHAGDIANPKAAALEGLAKMRFVSKLGVAQAVLPPHPRPDIATLRNLGYSGSDEAVLAESARGDGHLLRLCSSASSMWTANAATVAPSTDTHDGRLHLTPANLSSMFHRSLETPVTTSILRAIFSDGSRFHVHRALPTGEHFSDEGAANHTRLCSPKTALHLFAWGRAAWAKPSRVAVFPRRQTRQASEAVARLNSIRDDQTLLWQQAPTGIDAGAFHTDVLAVGNEHFLMLHEDAFTEPQHLLSQLASRLGEEFSCCFATNDELPVADAVSAYPFNSQLVSLPDGSMAVVAPEESKNNPRVAAFLERVVSESNPVTSVVYVGVNASMQNGGGPACLRLRVPMTDGERRAIVARVFFDEALGEDLERWIERHYRDRLSFADLADPALLRECRTALDELTGILALGSIYDFQTP